MKNTCNTAPVSFSEKYIDSITEFGELTFWEEHEVKLSYNALHRKVCAVSSYIVQLNCSLIGLCVSNQLHMTIGILACLYSGTAFVPCSTDVNQYLNSKADYKGIKVLNDGDISEAIDNDSSFVPDDVKQDRIAVVAFSSGTMSDPKGVCLTYRNIMSDVLSGLRAFDCKKGMRYLHVLPLFHMFGISVELLPILFSGGTICCARSPFTFIEDAEKYNVDISFVPVGIAEILLRYMRAKNNYQYKLGNLRTLLCGGSKLSKEVCEGLIEYGVLALGSYGMTECSPGIAINSEKHHKFGSAGRVIDCCEVQIGDDSEILIKGDNLFVEYYGDCKLQVDSDGWFHTKDYGFIDEDGYLWVEGRIDDVIVLSDGHKYSAEKIEEQINKIEGIIESLLIKGEAGGLTCTVYCDKIAENDKKKIEKIIYQLQRAITKVIFVNHPLPKNSLGKLKRYQ